MFLRWAHGIELEGHCDDDESSHLEQSNSLSKIQRHRLNMPVEDLPVRLEVLR